MMDLSDTGRKQKIRFRAWDHASHSGDLGSCQTLGVINFAQSFCQASRIIRNGHHCALLPWANPNALNLHQIAMAPANGLWCTISVMMTMYSSVKMDRKNVNQAFPSPMSFRVTTEAHPPYRTMKRGRMMSHTTAFTLQPAHLHVFWSMRIALPWQDFTIFEGSWDQPGSMTLTAPCLSHFGGEAQKFCLAKKYQDSLATFKLRFELCWDSACSWYTCTLLMNTIFLIGVNYA